MVKALHAGPCPRVPCPLCRVVVVAPGARKKFAPSDITDADIAEWKTAHGFDTPRPAKPKRPRRLGKRIMRAPSQRIAKKPIGPLCKHFGAKTGEIVGCKKGCGGNKADVHACALLGQCTILTSLRADIPSCVGCDKGELKEKAAPALPAPQSPRPASAANVVAVSFKHGLGDAANFAHMIPLYTRRGFKVQVHPVHADQSPVFRAGGAEIVGHGEKLPWVQALGRDNKNLINLSRSPMPNIGDPASLWDEYCAVRLDYEPQVQEADRASVSRLLDGVPRPWIVMHAKGFHAYRNYADAPTVELQKRLISAVGGTIIVLDRDRQAPHNNSARVCQFRDFCPGELYEVIRRADLLIGIDSGPIHMARFTETPVLAFWNATYPCDLLLPRAKTLNVVSSRHAGRATSAGPEWNIIVGDDGPSAPVLCEQACAILGRKHQPAAPAAITAEFSATVAAIREAARTSPYDHRPWLHPGDVGIAAKLAHGFLAYARLKWAVAKILQPKRICEIGVGGGVAALAFLSGSPTAEYVGIDNGQDDAGSGVPVLEHVKGAFSTMGCTGRIERHDSRTLTQLPGRFDLVHVDANHTAEYAYHDVRLALESGATWILVDDALTSAVSAATFRALGDHNRHAVEWAMLEDSLTGSILIYTGAA